MVTNNSDKILKITEYGLTQEIHDELNISTHCTFISILKNQDIDKEYKIHTFMYGNFIQHIKYMISEAFNSCVPYDISSNYIDSNDINTISTNILYILLHYNCNSALYSYITSIFQSSYAFAILTSLDILEKEIKLILEEEIGFKCFMLDAFNKFNDSIDILVKRRV